uniref:Mitotic spindle positioning n=1 Tax=Microcebus murinus TaxID=30608 RepID=A0A8B7F0I4_MICMU|nr:mitotic interactor and substrate of PLK1 [Microcebus murinus]XP_012601289.1 mitotic interactor and substrate of PLK1 [Microcebus murinus]XP_012601290.1 mitotic interactor and substrate of PLK1 [Microcebus murinus]
MDRVTRHPILATPGSPRVTGLVLDGDTRYTFRLVGVGPEAGGWGQEEPQAWPAAGEAWPDVARTGASWGVHSYAAEPEDEEDLEVQGYHRGARDTLSGRPWDLERERWAVIQGQAVRRSGTVATLRGTPDRGDPGAPGPLRPPHPEEDAVDREQIDFLAARQQFLSLEQASTEGARKPPARMPATPAPPGTGQAPKAANGPHLANGSAVPLTPQVKAAVGAEKRPRGSPAGAQAGGDRADSPEAPKETPIEREIRLAQEREADLRAQRGLRRPAGPPELVEIRARPLLTGVSLAAAPRRDRGRPSLYVQRDMAQGTQREEDHRREGLQVGRPAASDWAPEDPPPGLRRALSSDAILGPGPDARAADAVPAVRKVNRIPPDAYQPYLHPGSPGPERSALGGAPGKPGDLSAEAATAVSSPKAVGSRRHFSESSGKPLSAQQERPKRPRGPAAADGGVVRWQYFRLRPLRFRAPDAPPQAEHARGRGREGPAGPAWRLQRSPSSDLLEREVESVLRREREVAEERRSALFPEVFSPTPREGCDLGLGSRSSSQASGIMGSYSVSESPFSSPVHPHSGVAWANEDAADSAAGRRTKKEQWYAGINPLDGINSEILEATRVTRHKNAMAERWESRIYASEDED